MCTEARCGSTLGGEPSRLRYPFASVLALLAALSVASDSAAQVVTGGPQPGPIEASFSAGWLGGSAFGVADANLRTRTGDDYLLFSTESRMRGAPAIEARASYALTPRYAVEGRFATSRPELRTSIASDVEGASDIDVGEQIDQYTFEGALVAMLPGLRMGSLLPFASVGAGYLRQLHEGLTLVEEGIAYHVGGGARHAFFVRRQGLFTSAGLRGDVRLNILTGGIELGEGARTHLSAAGGLFVTF
jgi:hypothetical protein